MGTHKQLKTSLQLLDNNTQRVWKWNFDLRSQVQRLCESDITTDDFWLLKI